MPSWHLCGAMPWCDLQKILIDNHTLYSEPTNSIPSCYLYIFGGNTLVYIQVLSINILPFIMNNVQRSALIALLHHRRRPRRRFWVHPIRRLRVDNGAYHRLVQELRLDDDLFQRYFRLNRAKFDDLLTRVGPWIARLNTSFREAISPAERLAICLR